MLHLAGFLQFEVHEMLKLAIKTIQKKKKNFFLLQQNQPLHLNKNIKANKTLQSRATLIY